MTTLFWPLNMVFWFTKFNHLTAEYWIPISLIWLFWQLNIKLPSAYDLTVFDKIYIFRIFANLFPTLIPCFFCQKTLALAMATLLILDCLSKKQKPKSIHPAKQIILQHAKAAEIERGIESCAYVLHTLLVQILVLQNSFKFSLICQILVLHAKQPFIFLS